MKLLRDILESYYYHGTTPANAESIKKNGIDPSKSKYDKTVFLTRTYAEAQKYAKIQNNGKPGKVLRVHQTHIKRDGIVQQNSGVIQYGRSISKEHIEDSV